MTCNEIENRLPAYLENVLSEEEKGTIEGHLVSCGHCRRACDDLRTLETVLHDLPEIDPPPFFEQRIMARIREEEAAKRGIIRRLFYPLYVKVPLQAAATILIAVMALSIYRTVMPDWTAPEPPAATAPEPARDRPVPKTLEQAAPAADVPAMKAAAGGLADKGPSRLHTPERDHAEKAGLSTAHAPVLHERRAPTALSAAPEDVVPQAQERPLRTQGLYGAPESTRLRDSTPSVKTASPDRIKEGKMTSVGAAARSEKTDTVVRHPLFDLTLHVKDLQAAVGQVEAQIGRVNGRLLERKHHGEGVGLKAEIETQRIAAFLQRLEPVGRFKIGEEPRAEATGTVVIVITIIARP